MILFADMGETATIGVISAVIGAIGGSLLKPTLDFFLKKKDSNIKRRQLEISEAHDQIDRLEARIKVLEDREMTWIDKERMCQERITTLSIEVGQLKGKIDMLEQIIERVESKGSR